jgi:hypothetical protein
MATYYWVGGNGTWNNANTTNWATSTGGAGGFGPPLAADSVIIDDNSGAGTCTTDATAVCTALTLNSTATGLTLGGNLAGLAFDFTLTKGAISLGSYALTCRYFSSSNANTRSIAFGTGSLNLTGNNATVWSMATGTGFSYTGTPTVNLTYSGSTGTRTITSGVSSNATAPNFNVTAGSDIVTFTNAGGYTADIILTGFSGTLTQLPRNICGSLTIPVGVTTTITPSLTIFNATSAKVININGATLATSITFDGVGGIWQLTSAMTVGSANTLTFTNGTIDINNNTLSTGSFTSNNSNTRAIAFGTGNITVTGNGATIFNTNPVAGLTITGTPVVNATYSGATGTRTFNTGTAQESTAISLNISAGTDTVAVQIGWKNVNLTGFSGTFNNNTRTLYGGLTVSSGATLATGTAVTTFGATSGTQQITTNGKTLDFPLTFNGIGGTWAFQDALTQGSTRAFTITNGTVQLKASATSTTGAFATSGTNQKYLQSTTPGTQATLTQASGTVNATYLSIKDIVATGGATWNALWSSNNVDEGNNSGWVFGDPPIISAVEYTYALRSFTQPRRF